MKEMFVVAGKKIWKHKFIFLGAVLILSGAIYFGYSKSSDTSEDGGIQTATVKKGDIEILITGSGQVHAESQVDLQGVAAGDGVDVVEVAVKNDQEVREGDLIVVLDTTEPMKAVRNAQLSLRSAQISQNETNKEFDNLTVEEKWKRQTQEITVQQRQLSLSNAYDDLQDYYIRAPFDGIVTGLSVQPGDSISRDEVIASVITKSMYAGISLNEVDAAKVKVGNEVKLTFDALGDEVMTGKISKIDTIGAVSQNVVSYNAEIEFESTSELLKPGMSVNAEIIVESKKNVLQVSSSAVKTDNEGNPYVQLMEQLAPVEPADGQEATIKIVNQSVETGITDDVVVEIVSGLKVGDVVVTKMSTAASSSTIKENNSLFDSVRIPGASSGGGGRRN